MHAATMTNDAKVELKRYVTNLIKFVVEEVPKDPFVQDYQKKYHAEHMKALENNEDWKKLTTDEKAAIEKRMNDVKPQMEKWLTEISDQRLWQMAQQLCLSANEAISVLYSEAEVPDHQRLTKMLQIARMRLLAFIQLTAHILHTNPESQEQASYMVAFGRALSDMGAFPFDKIHPHYVNKILRYLRAIVEVICPPDKPLKPLGVVQPPPPAGTVEVVSKEGEQSESVKA